MLDPHSDSALRDRLVHLAFAMASALAVPAAHLGAQASPNTLARPVLDASTALETINGRALWVDYKGRRALHLTPLMGHEHDTDEEMSAVLTGSDFHDGVIQVDVSGARREGYSTAGDMSGFKGMIGVSFRVRGDTAERFYIRPHNSRLDDQLFRNRSTQYESSPDYPWLRLRQEKPEVYESYVDLEPGAWTTLRIEVAGTKARLYVNGASEPALIVNDLKQGDSHGAIALWSRISTDGYFANLRVAPAAQSSGATPAGQPRSLDPLPDAAPPAVAEVVNARTELVTYRGRRAVKLVPLPESSQKGEEMLAILDRGEFNDGTIEIDVAGAPRAGMPPDARGFIGVSFRTGQHGEWSEVFYLRPTNGRADDQLRRNHSVQYVSGPQYPWYRLRRETPGVYESYTDLETGAWTRMKIVVAGSTARLYVNGASQPSLVVNDLKHGTAPGRIALWANVQTDAYFGPISVSKR